MKKIYRIIYLLGIMCACIFYMYAIYRAILGYILGTIEVVSIVIGTVLILVSHSLYLTAKKSENEKEIEEYYQNIRNNVINTNKTNNNNDSLSTEAQNESSDVLELMSIHMKEIKDYYILSKSMAKDSFYLSVIMCILGFTIISASIIALFLVNISFIQTLIPVIGGAIVEVIAGTSLNVYKKSLEQLNQYYESLHNNERYLSLVSLVDRLSNEKKDDIYTSIINSQLELLKKSL